MTFTITTFIIGLTCLISIPAFTNQNIINKLILWPASMKQNKEFYRFISCGFIHADYMHLFFNMFTLYFFGRNLEFYYTQYNLRGSFSYILLYLTALLVSVIPTFFKNQYNEGYTSLGASGAVSAVVTASILFDPWSRIYVFGAIKISAMLYAIIYIVYCIYASKRSLGNINHDAHLWGSVYGFLFSGLLIFSFQPQLFELIIEQLKHPSIFGR